MHQRTDKLIPRFVLLTPDGGATKHLVIVFVGESVRPLRFRVHSGWRPGRVLQGNPSRAPDSRATERCRQRGTGASHHRGSADRARYRSPQPSPRPHLNRSGFVNGTPKARDGPGCLVLLRIGNADSMIWATTAEASVSECSVHRVPGRCPYRSHVAMRHRVATEVTIVVI
jgi:hypothetical protein